MLYHTGVTGTDDAIPSSVTRLLWDVCREKVDVARHARFIISRVLDFGDGDAVLWLKHTYGDRAIRDVVTSRSSLNPKTIAYWTARLGPAHV